MQCLQDLISQYGLPKWLFTDNGTIAKFLPSQCIDHIASFLIYPKSNWFIEHQIKATKTALTTAKASAISIDHLHMTIRSKLIGPHLPFPSEILHNWPDDHLGHPSHTVDYKEVRNFLIAKKAQHKEHHGKRHNACPLPVLFPGQDVLYLSQSNHTSYLKGTITAPVNTPRSYLIEAQGRKYCHTRQHIHPINSDIPASFTGLCTHTLQNPEADLSQETS